MKGKIQESELNLRKRSEGIIYIAKIKTWFDGGTEVSLIDDYRPQLDSGLFRGFKDGQLDEEVCSFDEFEMIEKEDWEFWERSKKKIKKMAIKGLKK